MDRLLICGATSALAKELIGAAAARGSFRLLAVSRGDQGAPAPEGFVDFRAISGIDFTIESDLAKLRNETDSFFSEPFSVASFAGGFWRHKPLLCTQFSEVRQMLDSHILSLFGVAKAVTPLMMRHGSGRLVAFSCNSVSHSYPDMAPFTAAKAAVETFIRCYANEYAPFGLTATAIALPTMRTPEVLEEKTQGDHENYIGPSELASFILDNVLPQPSIETGNVLRLMKPSPTFYGQGYFDRNPRSEGHSKALYASGRPRRS